MSETASTQPSPRGTTRRLDRTRATIARLGGVTLAVIIVGGYFSIRTHGQMLQVDNLLGIVRGLSTIAIMGLGLTFVIIAGEIDLSFANVYGLCTNIIAVLWITHAVPVYLAIVIAFLAAIGVGLFNAFFTAVVGVPSFIATPRSSTLVFGCPAYLGQTQE